MSVKSHKMRTRFSILIVGPFNSDNEKDANMITFEILIRKIHMQIIILMVMIISWIFITEIREFIRIRRRK